METATLDDFMALNEQLAALVKAGVPIDVGLDSSNTRRELERINAVVARRVSRGATLAEALDDGPPAIPTVYRRMVQASLESGDLSAALGGSHRLAEAVDDSRQSVRSALVYPIIVCTLAYAGFIGFLLYVLPSLEGMQESFDKQRGWAMGLLHELSGSLSDWAAIPPIALLLWVAWQVFRTWRTPSVARVANPVAWLPGMSKAIFEERCANFASLLAKLLDDGVPLEEGLRLAAGASGDQKLNAGSQALADDIRQGQVSAGPGPAASVFPPFLRWALYQSEGTVGRARALRMAADMYEKSARRRAERVRLVVPVITCAVLGGGITLLYGLALFLPVVEMLQSLAAPKV